MSKVGYITVAESEATARLSAPDHRSVELGADMVSKTLGIPYVRKLPRHWHKR